MKPSSLLTINGAYSYHVKLGKGLFAAIGIMCGVQQYKFDASKINAANSGSSIPESYKHLSISDINTGFWLHSKKKII